MKLAITLFLVELIVNSNSFLTSTNARYKLQSLSERIAEPISVDPNFEAHLANFLKVGLSEDRSEPDIAAELRKRFKDIEGRSWQLIKSTLP
jgi:hypothetical protein